MNINKLSLLAIVTLIIGGLIGYGVGLYQGKQNATNLQAQIEKAKEFFISTPNIFSISGIIKKITGNVLTLETQPSSNPFEELPIVREVIIDKNTIVVKQETKDTELFQEELAVFERELELIQRQSTEPGVLGAPAPAVSLPIPPNSFEEKDITLEDLEIGDQVFVDAGENIKDSTRFEATKITVLGAFAPVLPRSSPSPAQVF